MRVPIRGKMIWFIGLPTVIIFVGAALWMFKYAHHQSKRYHESDMEERAGTAAARFDEYISKAARIADTTARFVSWVPELTEKQIYGILRSNVTQNARIYGAAMAFEPGTFKPDDSLFSPYVYESNGQVVEMDINEDVYDWYRDEHWQWWHLPRKTGKPAWADPYFDEGAGDILMITYGVPFLRDGEFRGVTTVDIDLASLHKDIGKAIVGDRDFYILMEDGRFVYSPREDDILKRSIFDYLNKGGHGDLDERVRNMLDGASGVLTLKGLFGEQEKIFAYAPIPSTGWTFVTTVRMQDAMADFRQVMAFLIPSFITALALILGAIFIVSGRLARPIAQLHGKVLQIADGRSGISVDDVRTGDEIEDLAGAFGTMQRKVSDREEKLKIARETALEELLESAPDALLVADPQGRVCRMNAKVPDLFGYSREEISQLSLQRLMPKAFEKGSRLPMADYLANPDKCCKKTQFELEGVRKDGSIFPFEISLSPFHEPEEHRLVAAIRDITERKKTMTELRKLTQAVEQGSAMVFITDPKGIIEYVNPMFVEVTGYAPEEVIGQTPRILKSGQQDDAFYKDVWSSLQSGRDWHGEFQNKRRDGTLFWASAALSPIRDPDGTIVHFVAIEDDITSEKEAQEELEVARRQAEAANHAKSEFLSHMSHELRTPLNGVLGYAQILMRDPAATDRQRESLDAIINCGDHLLSLINDVLDLSKIEAGRIEIDSAPVDLHRIIKRVSDVVVQRAVVKGIEFVQDVSPEVPRGVVTDGAKLRQILVNLLGNAVKFTKEGSVTLRVTESPKDWLRFDVVDTGVGIPLEQQEEVFDPFKQVEAGKAAGGTGLGLAITKRLTEMMGGRIELESAVGEGSTFRIVLPLEEADTEDMSAIDQEEAAGGTAHPVLAPGQEYTILVADDRPTNRDVLNHMLHDAGFKTMVATDGVETIDMMREQKPDMVLLDVRMPRMNGIEAVGIIRKDDNLKDVPVIAVTASVFPEFREKAIKVGFDDFLGKPFRVADLLQKLARHLDLKFVEDSPREDEADEAVRVPESGEADDLVLPPEVADKFRKALKIRNLTALTAIGRELAEEPLTAAAGKEITRLARSFDFDGLKELLNDV